MIESLKKLTKEYGEVVIYVWDRNDVVLHLGNPSEYVSLGEVDGIVVEKCSLDSLESTLRQKAADLLQRTP